MKAFALASATPQAQAIKREVAFFQTVKVAIAKTTGRGSGQRQDERLDHADPATGGPRRSRRKAWSTCSPPPGCRNRTSRSSPTPSWTRCGTCRSEPRAGDAEEAAQRRDHGAETDERRPVAQVLREAGGVAQPLPQPRARNGPDHRGADRAGEGDARPTRTRARSSASRTTSTPSTMRWPRTRAPRR